MNIGIEAQRANNPTKTGVEHYAKQLIVHLSKIDSVNKYTLYLRDTPEQWFNSLPSNFSYKVIPFLKFWTQLRISWEMFVNPPDCLFIPASALPLIHPKKSVITIHDTAWIHFPEAFTFFMRKYLHYSTKFAVMSAKKVIAVSQATKDDLIKYYEVRPEKVVVVPHGYEQVHDFSHELPSALKSKLPDKYVLFLSTIQPRKNVPGLIKAFRKVKERNPDLPHKLVIVGKMGWKYEESYKAIKNNSDIVTYLGHIKDEDRWPIYRGADLFVHPSFYEGFGMWILEAFECEVPIAVSNISSLPEVGGDAAKYFDPKNNEEIANVIEKILKDPDLRHQMVQKGKERLKEYSWDKCASETLKVFQSL